MRCSLTGAAVPLVGCLLLAACSGSRPIDPEPLRTPPSLMPTPIPTPTASSTNPDAYETTAGDLDLVDALGDWEVSSDVVTPFLSVQTVGNDMVVAVTQDTNGIQSITAMGGDLHATVQLEQ